MAASALLERHLKRHAHQHQQQQHLHHDDAHTTTTGTTHLYPHVEFLDMSPTSTVDDTFVATRLLLAAGVSAIVVLGGDGMQRNGGASSRHRTAELGLAFTARPCDCEQRWPASSSAIAATTRRLMPGGCSTA